MGDKRSDSDASHTTATRLTESVSQFMGLKEVLIDHMAKLTAVFHEMRSGIVMTLWLTTVPTAQVR